MANLSQTFPDQDNYSNDDFSSQEESGSPLYEPIIKNDKKAYRCLVCTCEKVFRYKSDMERHTIMHTKSKPYVCTFSSCKKTFKRPDALRNHLQIHSKDCIFACTVSGCEAKFHKKTALRYHLLKHHKEKSSCDSSPETQESLAPKQSLEQQQEDQDATSYHQKLAPSSPSSSQKELMDLDCFFNHFEDLIPEPEIAVHYQSSQTSFDDEFDLMPAKFIHTETGRKAINLKEENDSDHSTVDTFEDICKVPIPEVPETANLPFKDYIQLVICKYLLQENQELKAKLDIKSSSSKIEYVNNLKALLKKAFSFQFDLNDA